MNALVKKSDRKRKTQGEYNAAYMARHKAKKVTIHFHTTDDREGRLYNQLKEYVSSKHVILEALEQYFKNNS